ncbi:MAG TPA: glycosyltransferase family 39 protein [Myxococcales bacterium]|nr:glycosyltransferase family 39 protein [Myxococcales bacterium]
MPSPEDPRTRARLAAIAGLAVVGAVAASWAFSADQLHGLTVRYWDNPSFQGPPARTGQEREPFVALGEPAPFSAEWSGWFYAPRPGLYRFESWSDDDSVLTLDDRPVVNDVGAHGARAAAGIVDLPVGLHRFDLRYVQRGGGAYLRVFYHYDSGPTGNGVFPLPWSELFPDGFAATPAAYAAAAGAYGRERVLAGLAISCFTLVLLLAWMHWRRRRGIAPVAPRELAFGLGIFAVAWITRLVGLDAQGRTWDERDYFQAARHYIHNFVLGDWSSYAFHYNLEHPPIAKVIYSIFTGLFATYDDDHTPGKFAASIMGAATCLLVYLIVKELYDRRSGLLAGLLCAFLPPFVAHGKVLGLESPMTLFYTAALYGVVRWVGEKDGSAGRRAEAEAARPEHPIGPSRLEAVAWAGLCSSLAIFSRMTAVWVIPTLLLPYLAVVIRDRGKGGFAIVPYLGGLLGGVLLAWTLWPWLWHHPYEQMMRTWGHWNGYKTREWYLGRFHEPTISYYAVAFVLSSPVGYLLATAGWAVFAFAPRLRARVATATPGWKGGWLPDAILAGWLLFPFLQSIPEFRQDAVRYVIQAFPALAATSAVGFFELWALVPSRWPKLGTPRAAWGGAAVLVAYALGACVWIHPYYLDYFNEILGGPAGIQRGRTIELSWWGEGVTNLVRWVNANAPEGARIREELAPDFDAPQLRADLTRVRGGDADYLVENDFGFANERGPGPGWELVHAERAGNQDIGWVYRRKGYVPGPTPQAAR